MFWIIGGHGIATGLAAAHPNGVTGLLAYEFDHSDWIGLRFFDLIWPSFMFMVGVSVALSLARRGPPPSKRIVIGRAFKRAATLFLLGSVRASLSEGHWVWFELSSALQPIAVA